MKRVQIDMEGKAYAMLEELKKLTEATSFAEVIRVALMERYAILKLTGGVGEHYIEDPVTKERTRLITPAEIIEAARIASLK